MKKGLQKTPEVTSDFNRVLGSLENVINIMRVEDPSYMPDEKKLTRATAKGCQTKGIKLNPDEISAVVERAIGLNKAQNISVLKIRGNTSMSPESQMEISAAIAANLTGFVDMSGKEPLDIASFTAMNQPFENMESTPELIEAARAATGSLINGPNHNPAA